MIRLTYTEAAHWARASASQVKTSDLCLRKWWFEKIAGKRGPETEAMRYGKRVHAILEAWVLWCKDIGKWDFEEFPWGDSREGKLARNARNWIMQTTDLETAEVEREINVPTLYGTNILGYIDLSDNRGCTDYKTCSGFKYVPSEEELRNDPQCVIYIRDWFNWNPREPVANYQHIYLNKKTLGVMSPLSFEVTQPENDDKWGLLSDKVNTLKNYSKALISTDVPTDGGSACQAYGGCPHQKYCDAYNGSRTGSKMGLFANLKKVVASKGTERAKEVHGQYESDISTDLKATLREAGISDEEIDDMSVAKMARLAALYKAGLMSPQDKAAASVNPPDGTPDETTVPPPKAAWSGATLGDGGAGVKKAKSAEIKKYFGSRWGVEPVAAGRALKKITTKHGWGKAELRDQICMLMEGVACDLTNEDAILVGNGQVDRTPAQQRKVDKQEAPKEKVAKKTQPTKKTKPMFVDVVEDNNGLEAEAEGVDDNGLEGETTTTKKTMVQAKVEAAAKSIVAKPDARENTKAMNFATMEQDRPLTTPAPFLLCVDCFPAKGKPQVVDFALWINPIVEVVQSKMDIFWCADKYNEGVKAAAAMVYKTGGATPLPERMYISSMHPLYGLLCQFLEEQYTVVVKG